MDAGRLLIGAPFVRVAEAQLGAVGHQVMKGPCVDARWPGRGDEEVHPVQRNDTIASRVALRASLVVVDVAEDEGGAAWRCIRLEVGCMERHAMLCCVWATF